MRRRKFILGVGELTVLAALPVARAQEAGRRYRIATLTNTPRESRADEKEWHAFLAELGHGGFAEGGNFDVDYRGFGVAPSSLEAVAIELTRARPDAIFATGPEAARAAQRTTTSIATLANDLIASGLVASMPHPEGNTTGVAIFAFQLDVKHIRMA
jgi:putative ABC transport system substrate-binding protein